jgi:hypothetical protein
MTAIAERLDRVLRTLPPARATKVERLVDDVLAVVEEPATEEAAREARIAAHREHVARCLESASNMDWSDFERPPQGDYEKREDW